MATLQMHRQEFFDPTIAKHAGRIFKVMGDGFLVEFGSVLSAVRCALEIQEGMATRNESVPPDQRIIFRIGVNLGDVIAEGSDLLGEGVNIAARLEALAEPGGICISAKVHAEVRGKLDAGFVDLGEQVLKNMAQPARLFGIRLQEAEPVALALPDKPSIAVLPFVNMSADAEYEFFVDGLAEDLITDLSRNPGLFVIARNSSFAYKGKSVDVRRIARELGVRYLLEGSARRAGGRVRINVQLIDSIGGGHIWAERFDRQLEDIFDLQDEVTACILDAMVGQLIAPPPRKRTNSVHAYDLCLRGRALYDSAMGSPDAMREAMLLLEQAIDLDPNFAEAYLYLASTRALAWVNCGIPVDTRRGTVLEIAERAVTLDPDDPIAHSCYAMMLDLAGQWDASRREHNRALELGPSNATALMVYAGFLNFAGQPEQAEAHMLRAWRLNPHPPA
jgi:TolB-like protein